MLNSNSSDSELLKSLLEPLLDDFQFWFMKAQLLLEGEEAAFLDTAARADLLARVITAQQEVSTAQMLFKVTGGQVGIETSVLALWHKLVTECWRVAMRVRIEKSAEKER